MEIKENSEYLFASCEVNWKIENLVFVYPFNNYSILSPELCLQGLKSVYWKMSLELHDGNTTEIADIEQSFEKVTIEKSSKKASSKMPHENIDTITSPENGLVSFYLEILPSSSAKNVFVNWEMTITFGTKVFGPYKRKVTFQEHSSKHGHIGIATTNEIIQDLLLLKDDTINIRFSFIAFDKDKFFMPKDEKPLGMFHLYKDIKSFKDMEENYSDVQLKVQNKYIKAHKIILSCNEQFDNFINEAVNDVVEISNFDYRTLDAFVNFLYSQELKYCLEELSPSMMRCLNQFKCDALKTYYFPEEFPLNSKIKIQKYEFQWYVPDILYKTENFTNISPPFQFPCTSTTWRLTLSKNAGDRNIFMSIFAEITAGHMPRYFSLEFALVNESDKEFFSRRLLRNNESYDNLGFNEFVKQSDITAKRCVVTSDCVCVLFRVITSDGIKESSGGCHAASIISPVKLKFYEQMSEKLLDYYKKERYHDILVMCQGRNYRVNRFILAARWPGLRQMLENNEKSISIWWIAIDHIRVCLPYLYTGVLNEESKVILELHKMLTSEKLNIPSLRAECEQCLMQRSACFDVKRKY